MSTSTPPLHWDTDAYGCVIHAGLKEYLLGGQSYYPRTKYIPPDYTGRYICHDTGLPGTMKKCITHFVEGKVVFRSEYFDHMKHLKILEEKGNEAGISLLF